MDEGLFDQANNKRIRQDLKKQQFFSPPQQFLQINFRSKECLKSYMNNHSMRYFRLKTRGRYFYVQCKFCHAKITLFAEDGQLKIKKFQNFHVHEPLKNKNLEERKILEFIEENQYFEDPTTTKHRIMTFFKITSSRYNYIMRKFYDTNSLQKAAEYLRNKNYLVRIQHQESYQLPELMIMMSERMKTWARRYNDVFAFDITYNLLKSRTQVNHQWGVGIFTSFDSNLRIIPIAFCIINGQTAKRFKSLFRAFISFIQVKTFTIFTDDQKAMKSALVSLAQQGVFTGLHSLDDFHLLRNLKKKIKDPSEFSQYYRLITTKSSREFEQVLGKIKDETQYPNILSYILNEKQRLCFSQGPEMFFGFRYSTCGGQKCNDMLKTLLPRQTNIYRLILAFQRLEQRALSYSLKIEKHRYEELFNDDRLRQVRLNVEKKIFQKFLKNYIKALKVQAIQDYDYGKIYSVEGYKTSGRQCQCGNQIKCGIPCPHMLHILSREKQSSYLRYFNQRWTDLKPEKQKYKTGARKSRRARNL